MKKWIALGCVGALVVLVLVIGMMVAGTWNSLNRLDQAVRAQWAQVQNQYQRRADLVPNLVATVKGVANFERETYVAVAEARASVGKITPEALASTVNDPAAFQRFQQAQSGLSSALTRLMVVAENYPELKANQNFRDLQAQLEGTDNRIAQERRMFNEAAQEFNTKRMNFPTVIIANFFGNRFGEKPYFEAEAGAKEAPKVQF
jgi:LemA protein